MPPDPNSYLPLAEDENHINDDDSLDGLENEDNVGPSGPGLGRAKRMMRISRWGPCSEGEETWTRTWTTKPTKWFSNLYPVRKMIGFVKTNAGLLLVATSQLFFALMNVAVKKLNSLDPPVPPLELVVVRMAITYICCVTYLLWRKVPDPILGPKGVRHLLAIRGFTGFFGLFGVYYSLQYLSLSDATVLTFLVPLTTAISGYIFLGEAFHRREAAAGAFSLVGVILIARPEALFGPHDESDSSEKATSEQRLIAVGVALIGVLGATGAYTSIRAIGKRAHTLHSMSYFSLYCVLTGIIGMITLKQPVVFPTRIEWLALLVMIGVFGFLAQALLTMGLQRETAGRGAMALYVQIIFASILERVFFHVEPSPLSILGTIIILGSAIYVAVTKQKATKSKTHPTSDDTSDNDFEEDIVIIDLELGTAEPQRNRLLSTSSSKRNGSTTSLLSSTIANEETKASDKPVPPRTPKPNRNSTGSPEMGSERSRNGTGILFRIDDPELSSDEERLDDEDGHTKLEEEDVHL